MICHAYFQDNKIQKFMSSADLTNNGMKAYVVKQMAVIEVDGDEKTFCNNLINSRNDENLECVVIKVANRIYAKSGLRIISNGEKEHFLPEKTIYV